MASVLYVYRRPANGDAFYGVPNRDITDTEWATFTLSQKRIVKEAVSDGAQVWVHIDLADETEAERIAREAAEAAAREAAIRASLPVYRRDLDPLVPGAGEMIVGGASGPVAVSRPILPPVPPLTIPLDTTTAYSRTTMPAVVRGVLGTTLIGINTTTGRFSSSTDNGTTWTDAAVSPGSAYPTGMGVASGGTMVFTRDYKILGSSTNPPRLFRAPRNAFTPWSEITGPWPATTVTPLPDDLISDGDLTLFFGAYNNNSTPGDARVYRSKDQGTTWTEIANFAGAKHPHALLLVDGGLYVSVGDAGTGFTGHGLYWTPDAYAAAPVFTKVAATDYGINMRLAPASPLPRTLLLEGDGINKPYLYRFDHDSRDVAGAGMLPAVWWDKAPTDGLGSWRGTVRGLAITPGGDAFFLSTAEGGAVGTRYGVWLAPGPWYDRATLLEDLGTSIPAGWFFDKTYSLGGYLFNYNQRFTVPAFYK